MAIGDIYYSFKSNRFYQEGRRGPVGRDVGVRSLNYDPESGSFMDSRGRTISREALATESRTAWRFTTTDLRGRVYITGEAKSQAIAESQVNNTRLEANQQITIRGVVTTADGRVHVFEQSSTLGQRANAENLKAALTRQARAALLNTQDRFGNNYSVDTPTVGNSTIRVDFYVRTIKVR